MHAGPLFHAPTVVRGGDGTDFGPRRASPPAARSAPLGPEPVERGEFVAHRALAAVQIACDTLKGTFPEAVHRLPAGIGAETCIAPG